VTCQQLYIRNITEQGCTNGEAPFSSPLAGKQFVLVGAGGAGRALAFGAKSRGARVLIFDIDFGKLTITLNSRMLNK
jgi:3-dehydroquinate dehydratase/shikimate dehydrogenase